MKRLFLVRWADKSGVVQSSLVNMVSGFDAAVRLVRREYVSHLSRVVECREITDVSEAIRLGQEFRVGSVAVDFFG